MGFASDMRRRICRATGRNQFVASMVEIGVTVRVIGWCLPRWGHSTRKVLPRTSSDSEKACSGTERSFFPCRKRSSRGLRKGRAREGKSRCTRPDRQPRTEPKDRTMNKFLRKLDYWSVKLSDFSCVAKSRLTERDVMNYSSLYVHYRERYFVLRRRALGAGISNGLYHLHSWPSFLQFRIGLSMPPGEGGTRRAADVGNPFADFSALVGRLYEGSRTHKEDIARKKAREPDHEPCQVYVQGRPVCSWCGNVAINISLHKCYMRWQEKIRKSGRFRRPADRRKK